MVAPPPLKGFGKLNCGRLGVGGHTGAGAGAGADAGAVRGAGREGVQVPDGALGDH